MTQPSLRAALIISLLAVALGNARSEEKASIEAPPQDPPVFKRYNLRCLAPLFENLDSEAPATLEEAFLAGPSGLATPLTENAASFGTAAINFPVTTGNPDAQILFNQGVAHLHTLWYREAERVFRSVVQLDPDCAMGYWGLAMANELRPGRARLFAKIAVEKTSVNRPRLEQLWIDILARFYGIPDPAALNGPAPAILTGTQSPGDLKARSAARIRALEDLVMEFPDEIEARAFLIRQLTLDQYRVGITITSHLGVDRLARELAAEAPRHPSRHYPVFLWLERRPERGLPYADAAPLLSPAVAEVWRYSGEAYAAAGRVNDSVALYEAALRVDHRLMEERLLMPWETQDLGRNYEVLIDTLGSMGRIDEALTWARRAASLPGRPDSSQDPASDLPAIGRRLQVSTLMRAERWEALLEEIASSPSLVSVEDFEGRADLLFSKGLALLFLDRSEEASAGGGFEGLLNAALKQGVSNLTEAAITSARDSLAACRQLLNGDSPAPLAPGKIHELLTPGLLALLYDKAGLTGEAAALARSAAEAEPDRLLPIALHACLAYKTGDRREAFSRLDRPFRNAAALADPELPALKRLDALAREMQLPIPWTLPLKSPPPSPLPSDPDSLGPARWTPPPAPDFSLQDHTGRRHRLADFSGKPLLLDFFLGVSCAYCVEQLGIFKPHLEGFREAGIQFVAVSTDPLVVLQYAFGDQEEKKEGTREEFPFLVLADPDLTLFKAHRAFDDFEAGPMHATVLLDENGRILWADRSHAPFKEPAALLGEARRLLSLNESKK